MLRQAQHERFFSRLQGKSPFALSLSKGCFTWFDKLTTNGNLFYVLFYCSLALSILLSVGDAEALESVAKIIAVTGEVSSSRPGSPPIHLLKRGDPVQVGDLLETGKAGKIKLLFSDQSLVTIMPETAFRISHYLFDREAGRMSAVMTVKQGSVRFILYKDLKQGSTLTIETEQALIRTSRADLIVTASGQQTELCNLSGSVSVKNSSNLVVGTVRAGENQSVVVLAKSPPSNPSVIPMSQRRKFTKDARQF